MSLRKRVARNQIKQIVDKVWRSSADNRKAMRGHSLNKKMFLIIESLTRKEKA